MLKPWQLLAASHLAAGITGYVIAPQELLETEVQHVGYFTTDTKRVLSAAVESLRAENKLLVYSYRGSAAVSIERSRFWALGGQQDLIVPASVSYYVDLSGLSLDRVSYDQQTGVVTVLLPPLVLGDVVFEPEGSRTTNGGLLTFSQAQVEELRRINYRTARRAFMKQAQGATLVMAAKNSAKESIVRQFEVPLKVAGRSDIRVVAALDR